jgi:NAD(P)-dependent dehydrogenase (short-subunit alcohol dehydrogenase family)
MTVSEDQDWAQILGFDRLPQHIVGKRVTELMDLSGKKAFAALRGVNVLGVAPGIMIKEDIKRYMLDPQSDQDRAGRAAITQQVQLGRASLTEGAANVVGFLASEAADYLCGQTVDVADGQWMN